MLDILAEDACRTPPAVEKLVGDLKESYSRRINLQHRLVYQVIEDDRRRQRCGPITSKPCQDLHRPSETRPLTALRVEHRSAQPFHSPGGAEAVADVGAVDEEDHLFGDIGGVVRNAL